MECKRGWSTEFMAANFPLVFRNDALRKHRRKVLFEREKAMLPAMQVYVEYKRAANNYKKQLDEFTKTFGHPYSRAALPEGAESTVSSRYEALRSSVQKLNYRLTSLRYQIQTEKNNLLAGGATAPFVSTAYPVLAMLRKQRADTMAALKNEEPALQEATKQFHEGLAVYQQLNTNYFEYDGRYNDRYGAERTAPKREFIMKCPDDGCRGFLSSAYKCGTCAKWTCSACLICIGEDKDAVHTCDKDTVETAKTIKSETRPCPKCGTRIFKIDGCDQMWCVMDGCHTAFSWNTGHVVTGVVHNPHYYEWLRRNGGAAAPAREVGDIPCGGLPGAGQMYQAIFRVGLSNEMHGKVMEMHRNLRELIDMRLADYPARPMAGANKDNDVRYLMQEIDEAEWQRQLEFTEAKFKRKKEIGQILQMLSTTGSDMMNQLVQRAIEAQLGRYAEFRTWVVEIGLPQLEQLREFTNESLVALAKREHMAVPQLGENFKWLPLRALYRAAPKKKGVATTDTDAPPPLEDAATEA